jgi:Matrixin/Bacterial pre-peptidase C-terminal domain
MNRTRRFAARIGISVLAAGVFALAAHAQDVWPEFPLSDWIDVDPGERDYTVVACFAEGTPREYVDFVNQRVDAFNQLVDPGLRYQLSGRWTGAQGAPLTLRWSFVADGLNIPNGVGEGIDVSSLFATLDARFSAQGGRAAWIARFQSMFDRWSVLSGLSYVRIRFGGADWDDGADWATGVGADGLRGDVRICAKHIDGASGILAYNPFPGATGTAGNMVLDEDEAWGSSAGQNRFLSNIIAHEHGHGIGLLHVCPNNGTKLMEQFLNTSFDGPQHDDIRGAQRHYGDDFEEDNSAATASSLGTPPLGVFIAPCAIPAPTVANTSRCSIDANGETDFWSFGVTGPSLVNVTVAPQGMSYQSGPTSGPCDASTMIDSRGMANLAVHLIAADGITVIATADAAPIGSPESLVDVALPAAGNYFVRVSESDAPIESQLYSLTLRVDPASCAGDADGDGQVNLEDLATLLTHFGTPSDATREMGDFDADGDVDLGDLSALLAVFGTNC